MFELNVIRKKILLPSRIDANDSLNVIIASLFWQITDNCFCYSKLYVMCTVSFKICIKHICVAPNSVKLCTNAYHFIHYDFLNNISSSSTICLVQRSENLLKRTLKNKQVYLNLYLYTYIFLWVVY